MLLLLTDGCSEFVYSSVIDWLTELSALAGAELQLTTTTVRMLRRFSQAHSGGDTGTKRC